MQPARREQRELAPLAVGRPKCPHDASVIGAKAVKLEGEARGREVTDQQQRDPESECDPQRFRRGHSQRAALVDRDQRECEVDGRRAVKQQRSRKAVPERDRHAKTHLRYVHRYKP